MYTVRKNITKFAPTSYIVLPVQTLKEIEYNAFPQPVWVLSAINHEIVCHLLSVMVMVLLNASSPRRIWTDDRAERTLWLK